MPSGGWADYQVNGRKILLLPTKTITTALTNDLSGLGGASGVNIGPGAAYLGFQGIFAWGSGGTTAKAWLQTSFDGGVTWFDIANMAFAVAILSKVGAVSSRIVAAAPATPTDATLADNTINNGLLGDRVRVKLTTTGTYAGAPPCVSTSLSGGKQTPWQPRPRSARSAASRCR